MILSNAVSDWISNISNWLNQNGWNAYLASAVSFIAVVGVPAVASLAKTVTNAQENKNYRGITLSRIFWLVSYICAFIATQIQDTDKDIDFTEELSKCDRMSDVKSLSAKRALELKGRKAKLEELKAKGDKAVETYAFVPTLKEQKKEAKAKKKALKN